MNKDSIKQLIKTVEIDTLHFSDPDKTIKHPAYLEIIKRGSIAVPYLLKEVANCRGHWLPALRIITKHDPVPIGETRSKEQRRSWIDWGRSQGYINLLLGS